MYQQKFRKILIILVLTLSLAGLTHQVSARTQAFSPAFGGANSYSVLGSSTVANTGSTHTSSDGDVSPGTSLPATDGAPMRSDEKFLWGLVFVGSLGAIALGLGLRVYRRTTKPRR